MVPPVLRLVPVDVDVDVDVDVSVAKGNSQLDIATTINRGNNRMVFKNIGNNRIVFKMVTACLLQFSFLFFIFIILDQYTSMIAPCRMVWENDLLKNQKTSY